MLNDENSVLNQINSDSYSDNKLQPETNSSVAHEVISNKLWSSPADASVIATQLEPSGQCQVICTMFFSISYIMQTFVVSLPNL